MAKKKRPNANTGSGRSASAAAARQMESNVSPILEISYPDPLFSIAAHPSASILVLGLLTGHVVCHRYNSELLESAQLSRRLQFAEQERKAFAAGKIAQVNRLVSRLSKKWWLDTILEPHDEQNEDFVVAWKTKRHKVSCRHVIFDPLERSLGENIYTVGADHVIKKAYTETGRVSLKVDASIDYPREGGKDAITRLCHSALHPFLLAGTENGHVLVYDSANLNSAVKFRVNLAHDDSVNQIIAMPGVLAYHYLTLGLTTLSHIDIRKGIVSQSDTQDDELLAMCYPSDVGGSSGAAANDTVLVAHGEGIVTIWKNSKNCFGDQLSRIKVNKGVSIEAITSTMNCEDGEMAQLVWCGDSDGLLHRVNYKLGKVVETRVHSPNGLDEVGGLDIDYEYRLISAGMDKVKIWSNSEPPIDSSADEATDESDVEDSDLDSDDKVSNSVSDNEEDIGLANTSSPSEDDDHVKDNESEDAKVVESTDDDDQKGEADNDSDLSSNPPTQPNLIRRKRRDIGSISTKPKRRILDLNKSSSQSMDDDTKIKSVDSTSECEAKPKFKAKQLTAKQLRNMQTHEHGIRRFEGL